MELTTSNNSDEDFANLTNAPGAATGDSPLVNDAESEKSGSETASSAGLLDELDPATNSTDQNGHNGIPDEYAPNKYKSEDLTHQSWREHKRHVFILTSSGKPVFSRYGDVGKLAGFFALLSGIVSFVADNNDEIRTVIAGDRKIVFLLVGHLYYVAVSTSGETTDQLRDTLLQYCNSQILSILTNGVERILEKMPSFDLVGLLGGINRFLDGLVKGIHSDPSYLLSAVHCLPLPAALRETIGNILHRPANKEIFYGMLVYGPNLVHVVRKRRHILKPPDLHLLLNFIHMSKTYKGSESWSPICLPKFNAKGFLYAYMTFLTRDLSLLLLSTKADDFYQMKSAKNQILSGLISQGALEGVANASIHRGYVANDIGAPGLLHFLYKSKSTSQMTSPIFTPPYHTKEAHKRVQYLYKRVHSRIHSSGNHEQKVYYYTAKSETIVGWITHGFELYAIFSPLMEKQQTIRGCNKILAWIKTREQSLFILNSPVW